MAPGPGLRGRAFNDCSESVIGEAAELVVTEPMPLMPLCFWNDEDGIIK
jgi:acetoacetyl-CoA synthetase